LVGRLAEAVAASDTSAGPHPLAALLAQAPQAARDAFIGQSIGALLQADLTRGAPLALTLLVYMEHGHNARAAAKALGVHVNTLHNRLESITGVLPGWNEPGRCLDVHLALRLSLGAVELKDSHAGA
jgi:DNA-binding PucR family transcriptional regulator